MTRRKPKSQVNNNKEGIKRPSEEFYQSIIHEAPYIPGDDGATCEFKDIPWADPELIKEGQEFVRRNRFSVTLAHVSALLYGFSFKCLTSVLLRTGGFGLGDQAKSMLRHVETGLHINKWYESDILESLGPGYKDVQSVRKLHVQALRKSERTPVALMEDVPRKAEKLEIISALKKDLDDCVDTSDSPSELFTYHPKVFFSQFDMLMTQFGFISMVFLFPKSLGIRDTEGLRGFLHMWAVLGKMLGIQDRFNLALHPDRDLCLKLFNKLGMGSLKDMDITILHLQQTYVDAISPLFGGLSLKSTLYAGLMSKEAFPNFRTDHLYKTLSWKDLIYAYMTGILTFLVYHSNIVRNIVNVGFKFVSDRNERLVLAQKRGITVTTKGGGRLFGRRIWEFMQTGMTILQKA